MTCAFFEKDLGTLMTTISEKQKTDHVAQAKVCIEALSTPSTADKPNPLHIEGWNDKVYDELRSFARELGADANAVNAMVDPGVVQNPAHGPAVQAKLLKSPDCQDQEVSHEDCEILVLHLRHQAYSIRD